MNTFGTQSRLKVGDRTYEIFRLEPLEKRGLAVSRLPSTLRILLENLLRNEATGGATPEMIEALARWDPKTPSDQDDQEIAFMPARVLLQDFTGVPAVVDLAALRDAMKRLGGDPKKINPLQPVELVIDHSVQVDEFGTPAALRANAEKEFLRNRERYTFLRWGQNAFRDFKVVPPDTGIVHQVNLEYLARVVMTAPPLAYPDTLVGTDSHTTMVNGLGVLGWGVGGIEAEAAMLGQPMPMRIPEVVGFRLAGELPEGVTATDLVLTVTQMLRKKGVVGKFVEFFGPGAIALSLADRATVANMAPEYGATSGFFPVDDETIRYLELTGRPPQQIELIRAYLKEQGLFRTPESPLPNFSDTLELDLKTVEPSLAGPRRPHDRVALSEVKKSFQEALPTLRPKKETKGPPEPGGGEVRDGSVVIAAITSCTNTSNPSVLIAAGLLARKAVEKGLSVKPWVKTSLAPGSQVVADYLSEAGLLPYLEKLRFHIVGYGCTTCIGNSGPLPASVSKAIEEGNVVVASVLSGNRNFEGRIHPEVRANYLASPPLVVAYALAGRIDIDLTTEPIGTTPEGRPIYLKEIWPSPGEINKTARRALRPEMFRKRYANVYEGEAAWQGLQVPQGATYAWDEASTYVRNPPYFLDMPLKPPPVADISGARVLALLGDSITTDHISPAGPIKKEGPAGRYLIEHGVQPEEFNSYGSRRGNHEVMMRGTFANVRLRNKLVPGVEGGMTTHLPDGRPMTIYDAAQRYREERVPLLVIAGKEYGSGSSRDWAAKGPQLLGVRAVLAESFERIHRSNLIGMGIVPLEFRPGESAERLGLTSHETFDIAGLASGIESRFQTGREVTVVAHVANGRDITFNARVRLDTPQEIEYSRHGGVLPYVLRKLLTKGG